MSDFEPLLLSKTSILSVSTVAQMITSPTGQTQQYAEMAELRAFSVAAKLCV